MKRLALALSVALAASLAACGDDDEGGPSRAFCRRLERLAEHVEDGDLATEDGLQDMVDTANDLADEAEGDEQLDAVDAVGEELAEADPEDWQDTFEVIDDELGRFFRECDVDLEEPEEPETTTTSRPSTTRPSAPTTAPDGSGTPTDEIAVNARTDVPADTAAEFEEAAQACFEGDMAACDQLYQSTPLGSVEEAYGATCGGRLSSPAPGRCQELVTAPIEVPAEVEDQGRAQACFDGDMAACDDLYRQSPVDSIDEAYGALCGGRVRNTEAFCIDIFGERALN